MNRFSFSILTALALCISAFSAAKVSAQNVNYPAPRESRLLNGARLLVWHDPKAPKVSVKIRIHSGSAFDTLGKEGTMQLLADILFPAETTREFFEEDLNGSFNIVTTYDYIQVNATGDADRLISILETLAASITNPQINKEGTERVRTPLLEKVKILEKDPEYVARMAAAKRLFGNYPYGRPQSGSSESLAKIDFVDLLNAEQRFFAADNATIAVTGNAPPETVLRASKRLFGGWLKADKKIPPTFAQPNPPDVKPLQVEMSGIDKTASVSAWATVSRNDKQFWAHEILSRHWRSNFCLRGFEPHLLGGMAMIGKTFAVTSDSMVPMNRNVCGLFVTGPDAAINDPGVSAADFERARNQVVAETGQKLQTAAGLAEWWLDVETFKLPSLKDDLQRLNSVTNADVSTAQKYWLTQPAVVVSISKKPEPVPSN